MDMGSAGFYRDGDGSARVRVNERVIDQTHDDLDQAGRVAHDGGGLQNPRSQLDVALLSQRFEALYDVGSQQIDAYKLRIKLSLPFVRTGQRQQIVDQPPQTLSFRVYLAQHRFISFGTGWLRKRHFGHAADYSHRGTQFMGGISDKTALLIKGSFQASDHLVKDKREGTHLVIGWRHRNTLMQIFSSNFTSGIGKMMDGPKGTTGQPVADKGADGENKGDHNKKRICHMIQRHMEQRER